MKREERKREKRREEREENIVSSVLKTNENF